MSARRLAAMVVLMLMLLLPRAASACATCIASPFGDQTYTWAYLGLILTPLIVSAVFGAVLAVCWRRGRDRRAESSGDESLILEETR